MNLDTRILYGAEHGNGLAAKLRDRDSDFRIDNVTLEVRDQRALQFLDSQADAFSRPASGTWIYPSVPYANWVSMISSTCGT